MINGKSWQKLLSFIRCTTLKSTKWLEVNDIAMKITSHFSQETISSHHVSTLSCWKPSTVNTQCAFTKLKSPEVVASEMNINGGHWSSNNCQITPGISFRHKSTKRVAQYQTVVTDVQLTASLWRLKCNWLQVKIVYWLDKKWVTDKEVLFVF